jgi:hypothetical protein
VVHATARIKRATIYVNKISRCIFVMETWCVISDIRSEFEILLEGS